MTPTHRHADGGLYRLMATNIGGKAPQKGYEGNWMEGVLYQCCVTAKIYWTTQERFNERFKELPIDSISRVRHNIGVDDSIVGSFIFHLTEADEVISMLIKGAKPSVNSVMDDSTFETVKNVLAAQAEMIRNKLHRGEDTMPNFMADVIAFHRKFDQQPSGSPLLPEDLFNFRDKFHKEETTEYGDEGDKIYRRLALAKDAERDLVPEEVEWVRGFLANQLDAILDALWVLFGTADIQFTPAILAEGWRRVVTKNMQKVRAVPTGDERSKRDSKFDIVKPEGWTPPDHLDLIQL